MINIVNLRVSALWGKLKAEMCALGGTDTILSPPANKRMSLLLPQLNSNTRVFMRKFVTLKERQKANG